MRRTHFHSIAVVVTALPCVAALVACPSAAAAQAPAAQPPAAQSRPATGTSAAAATSRASMVVAPTALSEQLGDPRLVLLHVGEQADYDAGHLPGARLVSLADFSAPMDHSGTAAQATLDVPAPDVLRASLERLGVSDDSRIVIYWARDRVSHATRIWFTLHHAGFGARAAILDGGLPAWTRAGLPTTTQAPAPRTGRVTAMAYRDDIVSGDWVREHAGKPGTLLVDARAASFYSGAAEGGPRDARRRGHIPGAVSLPFTSIADSALVLRSPDALARLFADAGARPGDTVVAYCHIGQQATAVFFAARSLGFEVKLYDGSFEDWARRGWPVTYANPAAPLRNP